MIDRLPEEQINVVDSGYVDPVPGSPYTGNFAVVKIKGSDRLNILFAATSRVNDGVRYVTSPGQPIFGKDVFAQRETYAEATASRFARTALKDTPTPVRDAAIKMLKKEQWKLNHYNSIPISGDVVAEGFVEDVKKQGYLTGKFKIAKSPRTSEIEAVFETKNVVFDLEGLPRDIKTEMFYDADTGETLFESDHQFRLRYIWLKAEKNKFLERNNGLDRELPVFDAAIQKIEELQFNK